MDKNTLVGFALIGAVIIGFSIYNRPNEAKMAQIQREKDSIAAVQAKLEMQKQSVAEAQQKEKILTMADDSTSLFYTAKQASKQIIVLKNNKVEVSIDNKGGRISKAKLFDYKDQQHQDLVLFDGADSEMNFTFDGKNETINTKDYYFIPNNITDSTATMRLVAANGGYIDFRYRLLPDSYLLDFSIQAVGLQNFFGSSKHTIDISWTQKARQQEIGYNFEQRYTTLTYKPVDDDSDYLNETKNEEKTAETSLDWIAFKNQYFASIFIAEKNFDKAHLTSTIDPKNSGYMKTFAAQMNTAFDPTGAKASNFQFYFGPNRFHTLKATNKLSFKDKDPELEDLVYLGWPIIKLINRYFTVNLFDWLTGWGLNMGIVILLMTLIVKLLVLPATWKSFIASAKMRALRPYIQKINEKYPKQEDALKKQQETMALYSQYGVSPMGGCLPALIQAPVFMALFFFVPNAIELRQQSFLWANDLSAYDDLIHWSVNIPFLGNHLSLFCLLFSVTTIISQVMTMKQQDTGANPQMAAMKWMMYIMPIMFFFIFNDYASGLSYYYFVSSLMSIVIMWVMNRITDEKALLAKLEANKKDLSQQKQSGLMAKMVALQKQQEELQKQRQNKANK